MLKEGSGRVMGESCKGVVACLGWGKRHTDVKWHVANHSAAWELACLLKGHQHCKCTECQEGGWGSGGKAVVGRNKQGLSFCIRVSSLQHGPLPRLLSADPPQAVHILPQIVLWS